MEKDRIYIKVCQYCGKEFSAYKSTTQCCSSSCSKRLYKQKHKDEILQKEKHDAIERKKQNLLQNEYLSKSDAARLLNITRVTLNKLIIEKEIHIIKVCKQVVRINKNELIQACSKEFSAPIVKDTDLISVKEALEKYNISLTWFYHKIKSIKLSPTLINGIAYYDAKKLKKLLYIKQFNEIKEWYSVTEIVEKFNLKRTRIYEILSDNKDIPRKRVGKDILISQKHWDDFRGVSMQENEEYYSISEATQLYNIKQSYLYDIIREHNIPKVKRGHYIYIEKEPLDQIMSNRKK